MPENATSRIPRPGVHVPALDGLRGLAILLVLYHHFVFYSGLRPEGLLSDWIVRTSASAWCGVDLFFVLSGFLITGILIDAKGSSRYFRSFYARRVLRIFPLYYGTLALWFLFVRGSAGLDSLWYWSYLTNFDLALHGWPDALHLSHFWSLAIEEQFYLVWPLVVFLASSRGLVRICIGCIAGALLLRIGLGAVVDPLAVYVLTPTRIDALAVGALLAAWARDPAAWSHVLRRHRAVLAGCAGLLLALFFVMGRLETLDLPVRTLGFSLLALLSGATIVATVSSSRVARVFSNRSARFLGRYSYALYVFHHPVCVLLRDAGFGVESLPTVAGSRLPGVALFALVAGTISLGLSLASWYLWESWFLRLKRYFPYRPSDSSSSSSAALASPRA